MEALAKARAAAIEARRKRQAQVGTLGFRAVHVWMALEVWVTVSDTGCAFDFDSTTSKDRQSPPLLRPRRRRQTRNPRSAPPSDANLSPPLHHAPPALPAAVPPAVRHAAAGANSSNPPPRKKRKEARRKRKTKSSRRTASLPLPPPPQPPHAAAVVVDEVLPRLLPLQATATRRPALVARTRCWPCLRAVARRRPTKRLPLEPVAPQSAAVDA